MEDVVVPVVKVDDIGARHSALYKWEVVVFNCAGARVEMGLVACALGRSVDQIEQPGVELVSRWMLRSASPIMSMTMSALIFFSVPSFSHFSARCRVP